ncbi:hypothetical protein SE17_02400 [Kouleothrix aurantiaca]|uniref:Uncharacterized protein n=1 Tax=Kouleothrix aurantiaca TaxID=186479 RepID=A0A0P9DAL6_9CHLR|nr:hypothetical protein SE17_02400 [Kouleothrix aurantiaca]
MIDSQIHIILRQNRKTFSLHNNTYWKSGKLPRSGSMRPINPTANDIQPLLLYFRRQLVKLIEIAYPQFVSKPCGAIKKRFQLP